MSVKSNTTVAANITVQAREIDFVSRFTDNWEALRTIIGISRPIRKTPGTKLTSSVASVTLQSGSVTEGDEIPYSLAQVTPVTYSDIAIRKYAKGVSIEAVAKYGAAIAIQKTDDAFLAELQKVVQNDFYTFLKGGYLTSVQTTFQMGLSMAKANVIDKFNKLKKTVTDVVGFVNVLDFYQYLGGNTISVQTEFGLTYVKNYLGYSTLFLLSDPDIPRNKIIAVPVENIDLYYVDPSDSDFAQLGLQYTVQGETNLIGFHAEGNYSHAVGETYALMGMALWAEYIDGISVVTVEASGSLGSLTTSTAAYSAGETGDTTVTISTTAVPGGKFYFKSQNTTAPAAPAYLSLMDTTGWTEVKNGDVVSSTNSHKYRIVELNGSGQAIASHDGTVVAKT